MDFNIEDFLPKYPNIDNFKDQDLNPYPDFYNSVYKKKEFNELKLAREEERPGNGKYYKHQKFIARFLSGHTLYNSLLLDHEMGTGKSCSAFAAIEYIKDNSPSFKGALVLTRGPRILTNLMKELAYVCTPGQYVPGELERNLTDKERKRRLTKLVSVFYKFATFEKFAKGISKISDEELKKTYSNMIILIDEVHNLRIREESANYKQIHRLLHVVKNCKIILMSGTPMKDDPSEIAAMLNLILPIEKQLPLEEDFNKKYMDSHGYGLKRYYTVKPGLIKELKSYMKGHVSYLKAMTSSVKIDYKGATMGSLKYFKVFPSRMSDLQSRAYTAAYNLDVKPGDKTIENATKDEKTAAGIYSNSRQATLFVFPESLTYGKEGFDKSFNKIPAKKYIRYIPKQNFLSLMGRTKEETVQNIKQYSSIYGTIIESILQNQKKLHFIYNSFVHGSGSIVLGRLLEMVGFKHAIGSETEEGNRYAILTGTNISPQSVERIIRRYNRADNRYGSYIQIIIGSKILTEGITLKNVQEIHITTPHWNYSELSQAISRGIRLESHSDLIKDGVLPSINVYQHVAIPERGGSVPSIDLEMYELCEAKDISIRSIERLMKESAVDCALFYERNKVVNGVDNSRECDYQRCDYKCDDIDVTDIPLTNLDFSTYNLYYKDKTSVMDEIMKVFRKDTLVHIKDLVATLQPRYDTFDIFSELNNMIINNTVVKNYLNIDCYVREKNNVLFLVDSIVSGDDFFSNIYTKNPTTINYKTLREASDILFMEHIRTNTNVSYAFDRLSIQYKRLIIETILTLKLEGKPLNARTQHLFNIIEPNVKNEGRTYLLDDTTAFSYEDDEWVLTSYEEPQEDEELPEGLIPEDEFDRDKATRDYGYAGQYNRKTKAFCIEKLSAEALTDVRKKTTGRTCMTYPPALIVLMCVRMGIPMLNPDAYATTSREDLITSLQNLIKEPTVKLEEWSTDDLRRARFFQEANRSGKKNLCKIVRDFMADNYLLYDSPGCGVQGRTKK